MARGHLTGEVLSASSVLDPIGCIDWEEPGEQLDGVAWGMEAQLCGRVAIRVGVTGSVLTDWGNSLFPLLGEELSGPLMVFVSWK